MAPGHRQQVELSCKWTRASPRKFRMDKEDHQREERSCTWINVTPSKFGMDSGGKFNRVRRDLKRYFPDESSGEDDRDQRNQTAKQGRTESNVPIENAEEEEEQRQTRDSDVRDTDPPTGTGTGHRQQVELSCNWTNASPRKFRTDTEDHQQEELSCTWTNMSPRKFRMETDPLSPSSDPVEQRGESQLTKFYTDRLKHAIEEEVEALSLMLTKEGYFSAQEYVDVIDLAKMGNRAESSTLFVNLVMGKGSRTRKAMWESFAEMRNQLPKLDRILKEIQELGPDPHVHINISQELPTQLKDVQQKHKETLRAATETLRVNTILVREKEKVFQLVDRYAELTVISTVRHQKLVEHELPARGRDQGKRREKHISVELETIRTDQLFPSSFSQSEIKSGSSVAVAGRPGIGKTTMVQKIVYDWATGKIYQQFQFVFHFRIKDLNSLNCRTNLRKLILDQYPHFGNLLREVWKNPEGLLFILDGLDEFEHKIDFSDSRRDTEPRYHCPDPESWCEVSDIVYSLIQGKLLPGCSVLVTTRPTALHLLEKAEITVWAEILGFVGEERKQYFIRYFEDQTVAEAVFEHVKENEILYTMSHNPSFCSILALALGPFFTPRVRDPQRLPRTVTQLYSSYICNILNNHSSEFENTRNVLLRVGQMAFEGASQRKIAFTDEDLIKHNLQPSQFRSGFLTELLEREDSAHCGVYTFPHPTIQEFVAALAQFLNPDPCDIVKFLSAVQNTTDGRLEAFLCFVAGLSSPMAARGLEECLGPFTQHRSCQVIEWVKEEVKRQSKRRCSDAGENLLNTMYCLFESDNPGLAQAAMESVETLSFRGMTLIPIDCAVLSHVIGLCDSIKLLDLSSCHVQGGGFHRLAPCLHKCQELRLNNVRLTDSAVMDLVFTLSTNPSLMDLDLRENKLGDAGAKLVSEALRNPECKIQKLGLWDVGLTDSGVEDLVSSLRSVRSLTELDLGCNDLGDSGVKLLSAALSSQGCKIQKLGLWCVGLTDSGAEELASALSSKRSLTELNLGLNSLTDRSAAALRRLIRNIPNRRQIKLDGNGFSRTAKKELWAVDGPRPEVIVLL